MSSEDLKFVITAAMPSFIVLVGILVNNSRLSDLRLSIDKRFDDVGRRFDDMTRFLDARFQVQDEKLYRVEQVIDARLKHLEERLG
jgi:hypothetical protein